MRYTNSVQESRDALRNGETVCIKNAMGDWITVDLINPDGSARVADSLSGFNSGTIGQTMTIDNPNIDLRIRDYEVQ
jgi:hypothetical protein